MKRLVTPELMDTDAATPAEVQRTLADLRRINRWFGGIRTTRHMLENVIARSPSHGAFSVLDVGAGSGDVSLSAARQLRPRAQIGVTLMDRMTAHLPRNGTAEVAGDALWLCRFSTAASISLPVPCSSITSSARRLCASSTKPFASPASRSCSTTFDASRFTSPSCTPAIPCLLASPCMTASLPCVAPTRRGNSQSILRDSNAASVEIENHYLYRMGIIVWKSR